MPDLREFPLLTFPGRTLTERPRKSTPFPRIRVPGASSQGERLEPRFQSLLDALEGERLALRGSLLGAEPELTLVLETVGPPQDFAKTLGEIDGLHWLGACDLGDLPPAHGFMHEDRHQKALKGHVYMALTNARAMRELLACFDKWKDSRKLPAGLSKLETVFKHLYRVRHWNEEDRLRERGMLGDWEERFSNGEQTFPFEAELWYRDSPDRQSESEARLETILKRVGGKINRRCVIPEIAYHGILAEVPSCNAESLGSYGRSDLARCQSVKFLNPVGQCAVAVPDRPDAGQRTSEAGPAPSGRHVVAALDGVPLRQHMLLKNRLSIVDPDGYADVGQPGDRRHGTAIASLICHGDLNENNAPLGHKVCVRPVLKAKAGYTPGRPSEAIPEDVLAPELVRKAVRDVLGHDPSIRVVNLSVADVSRPFVREISPLARLLDWLSAKHDILFIVCSGNRAPYAPALAGILPLAEEDTRSRALAGLKEGKAHRRMLSPAETVNGLTVGAVQADASRFDYRSRNLIDPFAGLRMPALYSAHGPGFRRSIKPDLLMPGGRELYQDVSTDNEHLVRGNLNLVGQEVAVPDLGAGQTKSTLCTRGTSNAAALATRNAALLHDVLERVRKDNPKKLPKGQDAVLIKALLVHGAGGRRYEEHIGAMESLKGWKLTKEELGHYLGYGEPDLSRTVSCTSSRATALGHGEISGGEGHDFRFPIPGEVFRFRESVRLVVTLAWLTPVNPRSQRYRSARLWFERSKDRTGNPKPIRHDHRATLRGTVQHEIFGWGSPPSGEEPAVRLSVYCDTGDAKIERPVKYGLSVTLEVDKHAGLDIYTPIRERLLVPLEA